MRALMRFGRWLSPLLLALVLTGISRAESVADLYSAQVPVTGQGSEARSEGIRRAFEKVLIKVTGNRALPRQADLSKLKKRANRYVQQYRYLPLEPAPQGGASTPDRLLWVLFDERAINRMLRESGIVVWGSVRPSTLIWLGIEQGGSRGLYQPELEPALRDSLMQVASERGLPVLWPLMDLEDRGNLQSSDLWGLFQGKLRNASSRYQPDAILVGRLRQVGGEWQADWHLYQQGLQGSWQTRGARQGTTAAEGLQRAVDELAARFAPKTVSRGVSRLRLRVSGLNSLADYVLVRDYLHSMEMIVQLDLLSADAERISFLVNAQGGREALEKSIMLGSVLEPVLARSGMPPQTGQAADFEEESLDYRLR